MHNIKKVSIFFRVLLQLAFVLLPIITIICWINAPNPVIDSQNLSLSFLPNGLDKLKILHELSLSTKIFGCLLSLIPTGINMLVLYFLIKLFELYQQGEIFSSQNVKYIRNTAYGLLLGQVVNPFYQGFLSALLTWQNPHGTRIAEVSLSGTNIGIVLAALLIILISWIMAEGCKLREEQQLTI